jgi:hypothetical protein
MSKSRGCLIIEVQPDEWWAAVAYDEYDYEFRSGEKFGPGKTEKEAHDMMQCSNPGSYRVVSFAHVTDAHRELLARLRHSRPGCGF